MQTKVPMFAHMARIKKLGKLRSRCRECRTFKSCSFFFLSFLFYFIFIFFIVVDFGIQ